MLVEQNTVVTVFLERITNATPDHWQPFFSDGSAGGSTSGGFTNLGAMQNGPWSITLPGGGYSVLGPAMIVVYDGTNAPIGFASFTIVTTAFLAGGGGGGGLDAAGVRAAVGLAAADLDTQLGTLSTLDAGDIRAAVGLAAADLDTQLGTLSTLDAGGIRAAVGLAAADLDAQLAAVSGLDAAGIRAAVGLAAADLDAQFDGVSREPLTMTSVNEIVAAISAAVPTFPPVLPPSGLPAHN